MMEKRLKYPPAYFDKAERQQIPRFGKLLKSYKVLSPLNYKPWTLNHEPETLYSSKHTRSRLTAHQGTQHPHPSPFDTSRRATFPMRRNPRESCATGSRAPELSQS